MALRCVISGRLIADFCRCRRLPYLNRFGNAAEAERPPLYNYDFSVEAVLPGRATDVQESSSSTGAPKDADETASKPRTPAERSAWTLEEMRKGARTIHHGLLRNERWWGSPFALVRQPLRSRLGRWSYASMSYGASKQDPKSASVLPAAFYSLLLEEVQGVMPRVAYIGESEVEPGAHVGPLHDLVSDIESIIGVGHDPGPMLTARCATCIWRKKCESDARQMGHLTLITGMRRETVVRLESLGVSTLDSLARADTARLSDLPHLRGGQAERVVAQARAYQSGTAHVVGRPALPGRAPAEAFIDFEGLGIDNQCDAFMFGLLLRQRNRTSYWCSVAANASRKALLSAWRHFTRKVRDLARDVPIFHYGSYERQIMKGNGGLLTLLESRLVDVLAAVRTHVAVPRRGFGLKQVAGSIGFKWRGASPSSPNGIQARDWWSRWVRTGRGIRQLRAYNEDDLRALLQVTDWLRTADPTQVR